MDSSPRTDPTDAAGFAPPAAHAPRASEARYRALATASADVSYRMSPDWREMRRLDGRGFLADTPEPTDRWLGEYILPDDQARVTAAIGDAIRRKRVFELEHRVVRADGTVGWTFSRAVPLLDDAGEITEWIGASSDITSRKEVEAALRESEERQAFLLTLSDALSSLTDAVEIMERATRLVGDHLRVDRTTYAEISGDFGSRIAIVRAQHVRRGARLPDRLPFDAQANAWVSEHLRLGESVVMTDTATDARVSKYERAEWAAGHARAVVVLSLLKNGCEVATFGVQHTEPREWSSAEVMLIREVAERTWAGERARAEAALHETQRRLEEALATGRMAYWEWDRTTDVTVASASMDDLFGLLPGGHIESTGQRIAFVHAQDRERYGALVEKAGARRQGWHTEFRIVRPRDGAVIWLEERATVTRDPVTGAAHTTAMVWEITDRKRAAAAAEVDREARDRDALRRQLVQAEEEERRRLARELHDEAGQHLTALGLGLQALSNVAPPGSEIDRRTTELRELANTLALEMHAIAVRLRPRALDDFGLEAALTAYTEEWARHSGMEVDLHAAVGASRLTNAVETAIYRVVQEALTNVARHSGAKHAGVVVERREGQVIAVVEDDGHGFRVPDARNGQGMDSAGLGLLGIRERVALLGGTLDVESTPGGGATLFVRIPIADETSGAAGEDPTSLH